MTNIGAVIVMAALILAVMTVGIMITNAVLYTIMAIPILIMFMIGYALVIKDHLDRKRVRSGKGQGRKASRRKWGEEE